MCIDNVAPGQSSHEAILFFPLSVMPPTLHIHSAIIQETDSGPCGSPVAQGQFHSIKRIKK